MNGGVFQLQDPPPLPAVVLNNYNSDFMLFRHGRASDIKSVFHANGKEKVNIMSEICSFVPKVLGKSEWIGALGKSTVLN